MNFREYLFGIIFLILLIWGPIDHSWPAWLAVRIGYLIFIPLAIWLLLGWAWNYWQPSNKLETTLERILSGAICMALFTFAGIEATSKNHIGNTQWIQTRDGLEVATMISSYLTRLGKFLGFNYYCFCNTLGWSFKMHNKKSKS
ncbi:MAG: phage holin family protein [Bacteroidetes bacterium]|nr:phage holin family protein [Bacteroidota bacterium]